MELNATPTGVVAVLGLGFGTLIIEIRLLQKPGLNPVGVTIFCDSFPRAVCRNRFAVLLLSNWTLVNLHQLTTGAQRPFRRLHHPH
jgi:hypothetical protein